MTASLTSNALRGVKWLSALQAFTVVLQLGFLAVMSRLLEPEEFGAFALAAVTLRLVSYVGELGLGSALIQAPEIDRGLVRQANAVALCCGGLLTLVVLIAAAPVAHVLQEPEVEDVLRGLSATFLLASAATCATAVLRRAERMAALAVAEGGAFALGYVFVGLTGAALGLGTFALVAAAVAQAALKAIFCTVFARAEVGVARPTRRVAPLLRFGAGVSGLGFLEFWASNLDVAVMGRFLGSAAVGQYTRASSLVGLPVQYLGNILARALLPSFARGTRQQAGRGVDHGLDLLLFLLLPVLVGAAALSQSLVALVLGSQWEEAANVLPLLCLAMLTNTMTQVPAVACEGQSLLRPKYVVQAVQLVVMSGGLLLAVVTRSGIEAFAVTWVVSELARHMGYLIVVRRYFGLPLRRRLMHYGLAALSVAPWAACALTLRASSLSPGATVAAGAVTGALLTLATLACWSGWPVRRAVRSLALTGGLRAGRLKRILEGMMA